MSTTARIAVAAIVAGLLGSPVALHAKKRLFPPRRASSEATSGTKKLAVLPIRYVRVGREPIPHNIANAAVWSAANSIRGYDALSERELENTLGMRATDDLLACSTLACYGQTIGGKVDRALLVVVSRDRPALSFNPKIPDDAEWKVSAVLLSGADGSIQASAAEMVYGAITSAVRVIPSLVQELRTRKKSESVTEKDLADRSTEAAPMRRADTSALRGLKIAALRAEVKQGGDGFPTSMFDDALLAALQSAGDFEVIGQADLEAVIGFEKEKELLGCDAVQCMAEIAGALDVDKLVVVRIAQVGNEWMVTAKLISVRGEPTVDARYSGFVAGGNGPLLKSAPTIMNGLLAATK